MQSHLRTLAPTATVALAMGLLLTSLRPTFAQQGDVFEGGSGSAVGNQTLSMEISQAAADLHHGLAIEIQVGRIDPGAEDIWKRSSATVSKYEPQCYVDYNAAHNLIPTLNKEFLANDSNAANATAKQASGYLSAADTCSNKLLVAQANTGASAPSTPLKADVANIWTVWNEGVASAISAEFQQRTANFRSQFNGARVPLSVVVQYSVAKQPWIYNGKNLNYHIVINKVNWAAIPYGNYGLNSAGLQSLQKAYVNIIEASLYAAQASYQSRLTFPEPVAGNAVPKSGTFKNDPSLPELVYGDGPAGN